MNILEPNTKVNRKFFVKNFMFMSISIFMICILGMISLAGVKLIYKIMDKNVSIAPDHRISQIMQQRQQLQTMRLKHQLFNNL